MTPLASFFADLWFRLYSLDWFGILDIVLVTAAVFMLLLLLRRSRAASLLRGIVLLVLVLLVVTIILPLPTFDWFMRMALLVILITTPILLQPELRRMIENLGRSAGLSRSVRQTTAETVIPQLLRTLENLATTRTGALLVLEGGGSLQDFVETGVSVHGRVSAELLQTIFSDKTPLHDGAVIMRGDQVVAAGCVLPLTGRPLPGRRRYGTRHRAGVGMSEVSDAFVLIVSEETGCIATAYHGRLQTRQESTALRQQLQDFYTGQPSESDPFSWRGLWTGLLHLFTNGRPHSLLGNLATLTLLLFLSLLFALAAWSFTIDQTNPTQRPVIEEVPLLLEDIPEGLVLMNKPATAVDMQIQTPANVLATLDNNSFKAVASLAGLGKGLHQVPVQGEVSANNTRILSIEPAVINVELARTTSLTLPVTVRLLDQSLSSAYQIVGQPVATPEMVVVSGPEPLVQQVSQVEATLAVNNATSSLHESRPLRPLAADGSEVPGVTLSPLQAQVSLSIARRQNAREVGIRAITAGPPPDGYWLSRLSVTPANVTLQGNTAILTEMGSFVDTLPVDITQASGTYTEVTSLNLPEGVEAIDSEGNPVRTVMVVAEISPRLGDLSLTRPVEILPPQPGLTITLTPDTVDLLLSGPLPGLRQIEANPDLVRVYLNVSRLTPGRRSEIVPTVVVPEGITVQLVPATLSVTIE